MLHTKEVMPNNGGNVTAFTTRYVSALAQHTVAAGEVPEAVAEAVRRFNEESWSLDLQCSPSARRRHLVGAEDGHRRAVWAVVAAPAVEARPGGRASGAVVAARAGLAGGGAKGLGKGASGAG